MSYVEATGPIRFAKINNVATAGDNELVAAVSGKKIRLLSLVAIASGGANTLTLESGTDSGQISGAMDIADNGPLILPHNPCGWVETVAGESLNLILSAATAVGGFFTYQEIS